MNNIRIRVICIAIIILFLSSPFIHATPISSRHNIKTIEQLFLSNNLSNTFYVGGSGPDNYTKIQDAIDNASDGDTVFVFNGIYTEIIEIEKKIELIGENSINTIIESPAIAAVIWIKADGTLVKRFTIKADIQNICIGNCKGNLITENILTRMTPYKKRNDMLPDDGIDIVESEDNTIINNTITDRTIAIGFQSASNNIISKNKVTDCSAGVFLEWNCNSNKIIENEFSENIYTCIYITENCNNNQIYHNNFLNGNPIALDECSNKWDDGKYGNYWSDYKEKYPDAKPKLNQPWMWDTPYEIIGGYNKDNCPLVNQWPDPRPRTITRDTPLCNPVWLRFFDMFPIFQRLLHFIN